MKGERGTDGNQRHLEVRTHLISENFLTRTTQTDETHLRAAGDDLRRQLVPLAVRNPPKRRSPFADDSKTLKPRRERLGEPIEHLIGGTEKKNGNVPLR